MRAVIVNYKQACRLSVRCCIQAPSGIGTVCMLLSYAI